MWLAFWLIFVFLVGASVGSFLNVSIARLPLEKSLLWPSSRCGSCFAADSLVRQYTYSQLSLAAAAAERVGNDIPSFICLSSWARRSAFIGLFWLEVIENVHHWPGFPGLFPWTSIVGFAWHALLLAFLIVAVGVRSEEPRDSAAIDA